MLVHTGALDVCGLALFVTTLSFGRESLRPPARDVGRPHDAVNDWVSSLTGLAEVTARAARSRSRSAALRASSFLASASCISLRPNPAPDDFGFLGSSSVAQAGLTAAVVGDGSLTVGAGGVFVVARLV